MSILQQYGEFNYKAKSAIRHDYQLEQMLPVCTLKYGVLRTDVRYLQDTVRGIRRASGLAVNTRGGEDLKAMISVLISAFILFDIQFPERHCRRSAITMMLQRHTLSTEL